MGEPIGALHASLSAGHAEFASDLRKARNAVETNAKGMAKGMEIAKKSFNAGTAGLMSFRVKALAAATVTGMLAKTVLSIADDYTLLDNKLKLVTTSSENLKAVQEGLYQQSLRSHSSYSSSVDLYARFAKATETMGTSQSDLLRITETLNKAMVISGATQQEATNGIIQLSQGMASGVLRGEEFNSIMENGSRIAKMLADYLHTDVGGLRQMATEGKITSEIMVKAFAASAGKIDEEFSKMQPTIQQAMTDLKTVFGRLVSYSDRSAEGTKSIAGEIANLAQTIDQNRSGIVELFTQIISLAARATKAIGNIGQSLQGWAAVKSGRLDFFEFATMNAEELNAWLKKNNTEAARIQNLQERIAKKAREITDLEFKRDIPFRGNQKYYQRLIDNATKEKKRLEDELAELQAPKAESHLPKPPTKTTTKTPQPAKKDPATEAIASLTRERDLIGAVTEEEKARWEIAQGSYKHFTSQQKEKIILLAREIDSLSELSKQQTEGGQAIDSMIKERDLIRAATEEEKVRWEVEKGAYRNFSEAQKEKLIALAQELDATRSLIEQEEERKANQKSIDAEIEALKLQAETFNMTATEASLYRLALQGATADQLASAEALLGDIDAKEQLKQILEDIKTPHDRYAETVQRLNDLLDRGVLSQEQYGKAMKKAKEDLDSTLKDGEDKFKKLQQTIEGWGRDSADAIVKFARTGEMSFSDMIDSMIDDLLRMMIYQNITSQLFGAISSGLGSLFGGAASIPATTGPAVWVAKGNVFQNGNVIPFAKGGIVSRPTIFPMAKGMGLMGEAGPEAVLPLTRTSSGNLGVEATGVSGGEGQTVNNYFVISSPDAEGFDRLCQRNAISIVRATNAALEKNVGRKQMRGLLGG